MKLEEYIEEYECNSETNNALHKDFTAKTESLEFLIKHRLYIEENKFGFGDRAFHFMWYLLLQYLFQVKNTPRILEIGVFKGQVISLWSLITKEAGMNCYIEGISPLTGNSAPKNGLAYYIKFLTSKKFRADTRAGNFYENEDYLKIINSVFQNFKLEFYCHPTKLEVRKKLSKSV